MKDQKISLKYILAVIIVVLLTWLIHEFAHWLTSELYGYDTMMSLNGTSFVGDKKWTESHHIIISAVGPIVTILQGLIVFLLLKSSNWNKYLYPILFTAFYMRLLAGFMNLINLNDEGRISVYFDLGTYTLPIIVSGFLFFLIYKTSVRNKLNWKFQLATTLIVMIVSSILILSDQFWGIRIL